MKSSLGLQILIDISCIPETILQSLNLITDVALRSFTSNVLIHEVFIIGFRSYQKFL